MGKYHQGRTVVNCHQWVMGTIFPVCALGRVALPMPRLRSGHPDNQIADSSANAVGLLDGAASQRFVGCSAIADVTCGITLLNPDVRELIHPRGPPQVLA